MEKWFVYNRGAEFTRWAEQYHISPVLARIIRNREVPEKEIPIFLNGSVKNCHSPFLFRDMERTGMYLLQKIREKKKIRVIGDYDVDGICSAYILTRGLQILGADVDTAIPHRVLDGYGLSKGLIADANAAGVQLIITCDNGIAAHEQIEEANALGMEVIVTDHHEVPYEMEGDEKREILPNAKFVIDPKMKDSGYPYTGICGAVVAWKLIQALAEISQDAGLQVQMDAFLEFAALATVCDVMELKDENRIIVKEGLKRLKNTQNQGIHALMEACKMSSENITVYHLGFVIGPCINATGRLDTAARALELLNCQDPLRAAGLASELKHLNDERKELTLRGVEEANAYLVERDMLSDPVYLIYLPNVHESLAGIIAGRIRETYHHPVFVLTGTGDHVKGSGRSIDAYPMYDRMTQVKGYFTKYGGHKLAAGLSTTQEQIEPLREALNAGAALCEEDYVEKVHIDMELSPHLIHLGFAQELGRLEPYGVGNPKPLFAQKNLEFIGMQYMGKENRAAKFHVNCEGGVTREMVYFGDMDAFCGFLTEHFGESSIKRLLNNTGNYCFHVTYQVGINTYREETKVQMIMQNYCS